MELAFGFALIAIAPFLFVLLYAKDRHNISYLPWSVYIIISTIAFILGFSFLRIFNYNTYRDVFNFLYNITTPVDFKNAVITSESDRIFANVMKVVYPAIRWFLGKASLIAINLGFFGSLCVVIIHIDMKIHSKNNSEDCEPSDASIIVSMILALLGIALAVVSVVICKDEHSYFSLFNNLFDKIATGLIFIGKALLFIVATMIIFGIITAIINDIRNTYLAAKKHVLGLLRNLYDSIYYANSALDNFCDIYAESSFRYETSWDVDKVKASCLKLRKEMEEWLLTADEKCKKSYEYSRSFTVILTHHIQILLYNLNEVSRRFRYLQYVSDEFKESYYNCNNSITGIQEKLEKYNEYTEEYNEIMSHFPYSWIEYFSLEKIKFQKI